MEACVIEVQGCCWNQTFYAKEICVLKNGVAHCFLVKQNKPFRSFQDKHRKIINWTFKNYHGIAWESGEKTLDDLQPILKQLISDQKNIYTKGRSKVLFLKNLLDVDVIDLSNFCCPSISKREYKTDCLHHKMINSYCAIDSAKLLLAFINGYFDAEGRVKEIK
jgi:hypothetical protein